MTPEIYADGEGGASGGAFLPGGVVSGAVGEHGFLLVQGNHEQGGKLLTLSAGTSVIVEFLGEARCRG